MWQAAFPGSSLCPGAEPGLNFYSGAVCASCLVRQPQRRVSIYKAPATSSHCSHEGKEAAGERGRESKAPQRAAPALAPCQQWHFAGRHRKQHSGVAEFPPPATEQHREGSQMLGAQLFPPQGSSDSGKGKKGQGNIFSFWESIRLHQ